MDPGWQETTTPVPCVPWDQSPLTWPGFVFRLELPLAGEAMLVKKRPVVVDSICRQVREEGP